LAIGKRIAREKLIIESVVRRLESQRTLCLQKVCCTVLQRVAMCCCMLQCVAVRCSVLQCVAAYDAMTGVAAHSVSAGGVLQCVAVCCSVLFMLQCVAVRCSVLQCVAVCCSVLQSML